VSATDDYLANNARYAATFTGPRPLRPARQAAVVACMDARIDVVAALGMAPGDAHIIRNAGGVVTDDVIRSLTISQRRLGTREVLLLHHTDCGLLTITDEGFSEELAAETGQRPSWVAHAFTDVRADVRAAIRALRDSPFLLHTDAIRGFVFDVATGRLGEVLPD
jgi:carbonic anhydrase